jgi:photosystem II stability/assembly factor-like uncharacterized protein
MAIANTGQVRISADSGNTWAQSSLPSTSWRDCDVSADGSTLIVGSQSGFIYNSVDSGATWISNAVPVLAWNSVALSADGSRLFAVADGSNGGLWRATSTPAPRLQTALSPGSFRVGWILPSMNFVLQQSADCTPASWSDVTNPPTLNLSNLQYEIALPTLDRGFYRLKNQ